ncbi:MAG: hypothetical protein K2M06_04580 [Muribaculaceae bacterium]|nr:hypothetical protein [Muribaculaceae bacterium]
MKLSKYLLLILLPAVAALMGACGSHSDSLSLLRDAETAYASHNYDEAQAICDTIVLRARGGEELPPDVACSVAIILVRLGEASNLEDENMASAWQSLRMAMESQPDSLAAHIRTLPPEDQAAIMMLWRLNVRQDTTIVAEYPDEYHAFETEPGESGQFE